MINGFSAKWQQINTVMHDFNGHEVNGIHGLNGKKCYNKAFYLVSKRHDFKGNFPYDNFFRKTNARLYFSCTIFHKKSTGFGLKSVEVLVLKKSILMTE